MQHSCKESNSNIYSDQQEDQSKNKNDAIQDVESLHKIKTEELKIQLIDSLLNEANILNNYDNEYLDDEASIFDWICVDQISRIIKSIISSMKKKDLNKNYNSVINSSIIKQLIEDDLWKLINSKRYCMKKIKDKLDNLNLFTLFGVTKTR